MNEGIFRIVWELKKKGFADSTIRGYARKLKTLSKLVDLNNLELVRTVETRNTL